MERILKRQESIIDIVNLIVGAGLFAAPWIWGYAAAGSVAAWTSWASGAAVMVMALAALARFSEWEEWVESVVGLWVIAAPWLMHFTTSTMAMWSHVVLGALVLAAALVELSWLHMHGHGATTA